jgi:hypothetical protein
MSTPLPKLCGLIRQVLASKPRDPFVGRLLAVDPGETTGISVVDCTPGYVELVHQDQLPCWPLESAVGRFDRIFREHLPKFMVHEAYHVYKWRLQEHSFSEVPTIQIIGALRTIAILHGVPYAEQTAQTGKAFFTDHRLKSLDMHFPGQQHARDSLRHAAQYLTFGIGPKK